MASLIGIRADESLNRYSAVISRRKRRFDDKPWTTALPNSSNYVCYPLYDWKFNDIWVFNHQCKALYNSLYDLMHQAGIPYRDMRICEPFGPEQRRSLWLYHVLEPLTWEKMCCRVSGVCSGAIYANETGDFYSYRKKVTKPAGHTWQSYVSFLLDSMPTRTAEHYRNKICVYLRWYQTRGWPSNIPDAQENDLGSKDIPSWRRICKTIIKNDYWCKTLSFSPTKNPHYEKYCKRLKAKRAEWNIQI